MLAALAVAAVAISLPGLGNDWFYDDLHLVRSYTADEMTSALTGPYDPDEVETPAWRPALQPLTTLRQAAFGERPTAHRLGMIAALVAGLTLVAAALSVAGVPRWAGFAAALLTLAAAHSAYALSWITDGYQGFQLLLLGAALLAAAVASRSPRPRPAIVAVALALFCLAVGIKEQALALAPTLAALPAATALLGREASGGDLRGLWADGRSAMGMTWARLDLRWLTLGVIGASVLALVLRYAFVSDASGDLGPSAVLWLGLQLVLTAGFSGWGIPLIAYTALAVVAAAVVLRTFLGDETDPGAVRWARIAILAAAATVAAAAPGLIAPRADLVLYPTLLYAVFLVAAGAAFWHSLPTARRPWVAAAGAVLIPVSLVVSISASHRIQWGMAPDSIETVSRNYEFLLGENRRVTIPDERRDRALAHLARYGVTEYAGESVYEVLYCREQERRERGLPPQLELQDRRFLQLREEAPPSC